jgi:hypothetical protein
MLLQQAERQWLSRKLNNGTPGWNYELEGSF